MPIQKKNNECFNQHTNQKAINLSNKSIQYKKKKQTMTTKQSPSRLRLISLLIPPSNDPLLTPYQKQINPKILPLKKNFSILSNIRESHKVKQQKLELSKNDFQKINRSYQSLKKFKKTFNNQSENEEDLESDPSYLNLIQLRKSILVKKKTNEKSSLFYCKTTSQSEDKQSSFFRLTHPENRSKSKFNKYESTFITQKLRYVVQQKVAFNPPESNNSFFGQEQSIKSPKYLHRR